MPRKKIKKKAGQCKADLGDQKCVGRYILDYGENDIPLFICDECGDINRGWEKFYNEYLYLYKVRENWDIKKHQVSCIIGFFCYFYEKFYGIRYIFVPQSINPYSSKECRDATMLLKTFGDANKVRKYMYWFFTKFINKSIEISSLGYLNSPGIIRKYNLYSKRTRRISRSSKIPTTLMEWCKINTPEICDMYSFSTINDLGAILLSMDMDSGNDSPEGRLIARAREMKLIIGNKLNIRE